MKDLSWSGITSWLLVILFLGLAFTNFQTFLDPVYAEETRASSILYVGENATYQKIQDAINASQTGDTVFVYNGTYYEELKIDKSIRLLGQDPTTTFIHTENKESTINITADHVTVSNFTITAKVFGNYSTGIEFFKANDCKINHNIFGSNNYDQYEISIYMFRSDNNSLMNNSFNDSTYGTILYFSNNNMISNNEYYSNSNGIIVVNSDNNLCANNTFFECFYGVSSKNSHNNTYLKNIITGGGSSYTGISLSASNNNSIMDNIISENNYGIIGRDSVQNCFDNNTIASNYIDGIKMDNSNNTKITNNAIITNWGDGLKLDNSNNTKITNNAIISNWGYGLKLDYLYNIYISNNTFVNDSITISDFSLDHWKTHYIDDTNTVNGKPIYFLKNTKDEIIPPGAGHVIVVNCTNITIQDQNFSSEDSGIILVFSSRNIIVNNSLSSVDNIFVLENSNNNTINNNIILRNGVGIKLISSDHNRIENNTITNNTSGIFMDNGMGNELINNIILENLVGLNLRSTDYNEILKNIISNNVRGVYMDGSAHNIISENYCFENDHSIKILRSKLNSINNNICYNSRRDTLELSNSNQNIIFNNTFYAIEGDIISASGSFNIIYNNNFICNSYESIYSSGDNIWNKSYPLGGNYWLFYNDKDIFSGPAQDQPGSDQIGDVPFNLSYRGTDEKDHFPLMQPISIPELDFSLPPSVPLNFQADRKKEVVHLSWSPPNTIDGSPIKEYIIYRGEGSKWFNVKTFTVPGNNLTFNDTNIKDGFLYYYKIAAVNEIGKGPNATELKVAPAGSPGSGGDGDGGENGDNNVDDVENEEPTNFRYSIIIILMTLFLLMIFIYFYRQKKVLDLKNEDTPEPAQELEEQENKKEFKKPIKPKNDDRLKK